MTNESQQKSRDNEISNDERNPSPSEELLHSRKRCHNTVLIRFPYVLTLFLRVVDFLCSDSISFRNDFPHPFRVVERIPDLFADRLVPGKSPPGTCELHEPEQRDREQVVPQNTIFGGMKVITDRITEKES